MALWLPLIFKIYHIVAFSERNFHDQIHLQQALCIKSLFFTLKRSDFKPRKTRNTKYIFNISKYITNSYISWPLDNVFQNEVSLHIISAKSVYIGVASREHKFKRTHDSHRYLQGSIIETLPLNQGILSFEFCHDWG